MNLTKKEKSQIIKEVKEILEGETGLILISDGKDLNHSASEGLRKSEILGIIEFIKLDIFAGMIKNR